MKKHLIKYKLDGVRRQKTIQAPDIYDAERKLRSIHNVTEYSPRLYIRTIKAGRTEYQVFGSVLG